MGLGARGGDPITGPYKSLPRSSSRSSPSLHASGSLVFPFVIPSFPLTHFYSPASCAPRTRRAPSVMGGPDWTPPIPGPKFWTFLSPAAKHPAGIKSVRGQVPKPLGLPPPAPRWRDALAPWVPVPYRPQHPRAPGSTGAGRGGSIPNTLASTRCLFYLIFFFPFLRALLLIGSRSYRAVPVRHGRSPPPCVSPRRGNNPLELFSHPRAALL